MEQAVRRRRCGVLVGLGAIAIVGLVGAELIARFGLGLGDPPLTVIDPEIEYLFEPDHYRRFGNDVRYNRYHMRADPPPAAEDGLRVLVFGDSVVNGGALTDQSELATARLQQQLRAIDDEAWVGNVSAGSWGPANMLAYVERFGWFDADLAVFVLSTHDLADLPQFRHDLGPDFPTRTPVLALEEAVRRYLPRYVPALETWGGDQPSPPTRTYGDPEAAGQEVLEALLARALDKVPTVAGILHPTRREILGEGDADARARRATITAIFENTGVPLLRFDIPFAGRTDLYRDSIHLNDRGQEAYAELLSCIAMKQAAASAIATCVDQGRVASGS